MRLASLKNNSRDGELVFVDDELSKIKIVGSDIPTLQFALDHWQNIYKTLTVRYKLFLANKSKEADYIADNMHAPLPRAYQWLDGSAYVHHVELARKSRGVVMPESFWVEPLMYQGGSDTFLSATDDFVLIDEKFGLDLEAELAVVTDDVPLGVNENEALDHIRLIVLLNDWSYRELISPELAKGFGFVNSKPSTSFAPIALTPDEFGDLWKEGKLNLTVESKVNDIKIGEPNASEDMVFGFGKLISHAAKTRNLSAGSIIGSGTIANRNLIKGSSCLMEKRMLEILANGKASTPYLKFGDTVSIEVFNNNKSIFGAIHQKVVKG